jgi:hypothetical protein
MYEKIESFSCETNINGESYVYKYFLLYSLKKMTIENSEIEIPCYGIEITRERLGNDGVIDIYSENINCISPQKSKVIQLLYMLKENEVSPIHLVDIAGEFVDDCVGDFDLEISNESRKLAYV